jgi:penicillin-binding protein 1A
MALVKSRGMRVLLVAGCLVVTAGLGAAVGFYFAFVRDLPDLRSVEDYRPPMASRVRDREGRLVGEFFVERRQLTPYHEIPDHVVRAFVAGEDSTFFEHSGIDFLSILRAAWVNVRAGGEIKQGGSTITQQMVKGLLLSPERKLRRKIREMILARDIEQRFTKEEILYLYLNQIYFGHGAYGIGEAARTYFGKSVGDLTISEGALLAGLPKAPSRYSPHANPEQAEQRRRYVLERMNADGFLDDRTYRTAVDDVPVVAEAGAWEHDYAVAAYFTEEVRRYLFEVLGGDTVLTGGLEIETTIDLELQRAAVRAVRRGLGELTRRQGYRGPLRRVAREEISAELEVLARENGLAPEEELLPDEDAEPLEGEPEPGSAPEPPPDLEIAAEGSEAEGSPAPTEPPELTGDGPFLGVVTEVDVKGKTARVAFAPEVEATVRLEDVTWAREPNPGSAPRKVRAIEQVFQVGHVTRFERVADAPKDPSKEGPIFVTLHQDPLVEGALLSIDVGTQEVLALVGGYDFERSQFNRVTQARRQPGSAFKPFIYGAALARDYTPASIIFDRPVVYTDEESGFVWRPRNYGRAFYGPITLREALARSVNNATVHLFRDVGVDFVIDYARSLGIESPLNRDLSLALGSSGVSLLEITRGYSVFAAQGRRVEPTFIRRVTNAEGEVLLENVLLGDTLAEPDDEEIEALELAEPAPVEVAEAPEEAFVDELEEEGSGQLLPPEQAYLVTDLLRAVVVDPDGTGWRLRALRRPVAGKTGTTNEQADAWFIGFTPDVATGVWVGHDVSRFLGWGETGSRAAAPIWVEFMQAALAERPVRDFPVPEPIVFARIDRRTGLLADTSSRDTVFQAFLADRVPTESSQRMQTRTEGRRLLRMDDF